MDDGPKNLLFQSLWGNNEMDAEAKELLDGFVVEGRENLELAQKKLLALESAPDPETINELFRAIHTVKGASGFFRLTQLGGLAHAGESVMSKIRDGDIEVTADVVDLLLKTNDALLQMLDRDDLGQGVVVDELVGKLESALGKTPAAPRAQEGAVSGPATKAMVQAVVPVQASLAAQPAGPTVPAVSPVPNVSPMPALSSVPNLSAPTSAGRTGAAGSAAPTTIRIGVDVLDELLELIGEVVLGRNQLITRHRDDPVFKGLSRSITRLHQHVIRTRMQSVGSLFERYRRTVRDLSQQLGKKIEISIEGGDLELDRTVLEGLSDPLTHLVRNAVDHGLESAEERSTTGKQVVGVVSLRALHESGQVMIEVEDDGRGIDHERVRVKIVEKGLASTEEAAKLSEKELVAYIFHPGFSTRDVANEVSGRGVGMDVVKTNLERLGCTVEVSSRKGKGTLVSISIPLTQAMVNSSVISGLIVGIGVHTLAIPQMAVNEVVRLSGEDRRTRIEFVHGREVFKLRDKVIPLVHLEDILGIPRTYAGSSQPTGLDRREQIRDRRGNPADQASTDRRQGADRRQRVDLLIVLHFKQNWFGVLVDRIVGTEEIVVRRPPELLKGRRVFAGSTILGNGMVSLILDIGGMVESAKLDFVDRSRAITAHMGRSSMREVEQRVVVFSYAEGEYFAIPVNLLSEVDRCSVDEMRRVGKREFIQRHGASVPLLRLDKHLDVTPLDLSRRSFVVLMPSRLAYPTAIVAGRIEGTIVLGEDINTKEADEKGIMGTFFHEGRLVNLLDIYSLLQKSDPERYRSEVRPAIQDCRILLAEDQLFFRQLVVQYFKSHGIRSVVAVADGREAIDELGRNPTGYDVVVSDIEMPVMNGYQLVSMIKSDPRLARIPVMALTSLEGEANIQKGFEAGFDAYEIKLDKDKVLRCLDRLLSGRATAKREI
ncbi:MAG: chemotaxis protein CheW [Fibrobacteres bacterium]|nr:chemotaxis protein CheW [Fibrobacterota bacterium]